MFVDVSSLLNNVNVVEFVDIYCYDKNNEPDEFGIVSPISHTKIENVACGIIENLDNEFDTNSGSYVSRVVYDFYIPYSVYSSNNLSGAIFQTSDKRKFMGSKILLSKRYASHAIIRCTEVKYNDTV